MTFEFKKSAAASHLRLRAATGALLVIAAAQPAAAQNAQELQGIFIDSGSALLEPVDASTIGNAVSVVTGEQLENRQTQSVSDALRTIPGIAVSRAGAFGSQTQIRMRGAESNHTLVFIDGIEANDTTNGEFDFSQLLAEGIERVEVVRGPQSGVFGSNALAGVINIVTKDGRNEPLTVTASLEGGSFDTRQFSASARGGNDFVWGSVGIVDTRTSGFNVSPIGDEDDGARRRNLRAKGGIQVTPWLSFEGVVNRLDNKAEIENFGDPPGAAVGDFLTVLDDDDEVSTTSTLLSKGTARLAFFDEAWVTRLYVERGRSSIEAQGDFPNLFDSDRDKIGAVSSVKFDTGWGIAARHNFIGLIEREDEAFESDQTGDRPERQQDSLAGEYRGEFAEQVFVRAAVRSDDSSAFGAFTTYSLSGAWQVPVTGSRLHASTGTGVVFPTLFEQFGAFPQFGFVANPNLQPEESRGYDIGVEQAFFGGKAIIDVTYFNQNLESEIVNPFAPVNALTESEREGIEVTLALKPFDGVTVTGSYTYLEASGGDGLAEVRRPEHSGSVNVNYAFAQGRGNINVGAIYNGEMPDSAFEIVGFGSFMGFNFSLTEPRLITLDDYVLLNVAAHYDVTEEIRVFGRVENVLDQEYQEIFGFQSAPIAAYGGVRIKLGGDRATASLE